MFFWTRAARRGRARAHQYALLQGYDDQRMHDVYELEHAVDALCEDLVHARHRRGDPPNPTEDRRIAKEALAGSWHAQRIRMFDRLIREHIAEHGLDPDSPERYRHRGTLW